jgi:hypothetical protein
VGSGGNPLVTGKKRKLGAEELVELVPKILHVVFSDAGEAELVENGQEVTQRTDGW